MITVVTERISFVFEWCSVSVYAGKVVVIVELVSDGAYLAELKERKKERLPGLAGWLADCLS